MQTGLEGLSDSRHIGILHSRSQQRDRVRGDRLAAADGVDALVGLALDADARSDRCRARRPATARIASMWSRSFGVSSITVTSTLPTSNPCSAASDTARRSRSRLDASFHRGSESGKCRPMSPRHAAPRMASVIAWHTTSASEWPKRAALGRNRDAAEHQRPSGDQPMEIVAGAGPAGARRPATRLLARSRQRLADPPAS